MSQLLKTECDKLEKFEAAAAKRACKKMHIPHPKEDDWKALQAKYQLPDPIKIDDLVSQVELPRDWQLLWKKDTRDCDIVDADGNVVGGTTLSGLFYDRWGFTWFTPAVLKK